MKFINLSISLFFLGSAFLPEGVSANRRHFTYTYESAILPKASHEVEIWNTIRSNRKNFYRGIDTRLEFEFGLGGNFQTSLYLNTSSAAVFDGSNSTILSDQSFGFSNEWKWKLLDPVADPIGAAIYAEGSFTSSEIELEGKIILDKKIDELLLAFNAIGEHSYVSGVDSPSEFSTQTEEIMELVGGAAYFITPNFTIGIEARQHIKRPPGFEGGGTYSAFFAGPSLSVAGENWWAAFSMMPQIGGSSKAENGTISTEKLELTAHEKLEARILLSFEF